MYLVDFAVEKVVMVLSSDSTTTLLFPMLRNIPVNVVWPKPGTPASRRTVSMDGKQRAMISQEGSPRTKVNTARRC